MKSKREQRFPVFATCVLCGGSGAYQKEKDNADRVYCTRPMCQKRYDLMMWGQAHNYPNLYCFPYAIGPSGELWEVVLIVSDAMIDALMIAAQQYDTEAA